MITSKKAPGYSVTPGIVTERTATIANGQSLSGIVALEGEAIVGIIMPSAWTAADLTFQASSDGTNFYNMYDYLGTEVTVKADVSRFIKLNPADWIGFHSVKVRSGTSAVTVNQTADRTLKIITRAV